MLWILIALLPRYTEFVIIHTYINRVASAPQHKKNYIIDA